MVRENFKHISSLKQDKQMKRGKHDWQACQTLYVTKWIDNKSVILLSNYHDPRVVGDTKRRVMGSKDKVKVSCPTVICDYNQYFLHFLDISVVNPKIIYDKMDSTMDFHFSHACSMIRKFSNRKRAAPRH